MKKNYTLKRELTFLMILTSVCTLLSVCAAVFYVFFAFFFQKTQEDIEYVLRYTSQQYEAHMQFIEDSVIAIRHNTVLDDFFQKEEYDLEEIEPQLSYSMELFSERNMVERQLPFVTGIYLFNNGNDLMLTRAATYSSIASCFVLWLSRTALRMLRFMSRMVFWLFATTIFLSLVFPSRRVCLPVARSTGHGVYIPHGGRRGV